MGILGMRFVQLGKQANLGTAVAATTRIWCEPTWPHNKASVVRRKAAVGRLVPAHRVVVVRKWGELPMVMDATFEQICYPLGAGIVGVAGVQDGAGSGYVRTYPLPVNSSPTLYYYTLEGGDNQQEYEIKDAFIPTFQLSWKAPGEGGGEDGLWMVNATWTGSEVTKDTATAALTLPTVESILSPKVYVDAVGSIGTTQKTQTLLAADFTYRQNRAVWHANGAQTFDQVVAAKGAFASPSTLQLTFEHDATGEAEYDAWLAGTQRAIRLISTGAALGTPGDVYSYKTFQLDFYGTLVGEPEIGEQDGDNTITFTYEHSYYDTVTDDAGQIVVVNELAALP